MKEEANVGEIIGRIRRGDTTAADEFVELLHPTISSVVHRCCPWREEYRDMVQEVFLKIFQHLDQLQTSGRGVFNWARRIALTTCLNHQRRWRSRPELRWADLSEEQATLLEQSPLLGKENNLTQQIAARDLIAKLLEQLEPTDRMIIELLDLEQCNLSEIRRLTGWSLINIRVRAFRARRKLKAALRRLMEDNHYERP